jgi:uncharacterized protein YndB with AHSA1/START domain
VIERLGAAPPGTVLQVRRTIAAAPEEVFRAWTDPELFQLWFRPAATRNEGAELDVRPGGRWRVRLRSAGRRYFAFGEYVAIEPPRRLVFTLGWDRVPLVNPTDSVVTVELTEHGDDTELVLTQERLRTVPERVWHAVGWRMVLGRLVAQRTRNETRPTRGRSLFRR